MTLACLLAAAAPPETLLSEAPVASESVASELVASELVASETVPSRANVPEKTRVLVIMDGGASAEQHAAIYAGLAAAGVTTVNVEERRGTHQEVTSQVATKTDALRAENLQARARWRELDFDAAATSLDRAEQIFLKLESPSNGLSMYADTLLLRAELALARQDAAKATTELRLLARIDPTRKELHPGLYAPALVDAFTAARQANDDAAIGFLTLTPRTGAGAAVSATLDQEVIEGAGASVTSSIRPREGPHLVIVTAPGRQSFALRIAITAQSPLVLTPFLASPFAERERFQLVKRVRKLDDSGLGPLAQKTGANAILIVGIPKGRAPALWMASMEPTQRLAVGIIRANNPVALGTAVRQTLNVVEARTPEADDDGGSFWIITGAGIATGIVAASGMAVGLGILVYRKGYPGQTIKPVPPIHLPGGVSCCSLP